MIGELAAATRSSRRRMMKLNAPRAGDMFAYAWLVIAVLARFAANCALALRELTRGSRAAGLAISEFTMLHFLLVVFLLAFLSSTLSLGAPHLNRRRLALMGVPRRSLILAELLALVTWPMTVVTFLFAAPAVLPLCALPRAVPAAASLLLGFGAALFGGVALGHALTLSAAARRISGAFRIVFMAALLGLVLANFDYEWNGATVYLFLFQKRFVLDNGAGGGFLAYFRPWSPSAWIVNGRAAPCALLAASMLALYAAAIGAVFAAAGLAEPPRAARVVPGRRARRGAAHRQGTGPLVFRHELRHIASSVSALFGMAVGLGCAAWLLVTRPPTVGIPLLGAFLILVAGFPYATNVFGRDGGALRRYALAGADWGAVFAAKNRAWLLVTGSCCVPLAAAAVRVSPGAALSFSLGAVLVLLLTVVWGNLSSLLYPAARLARGSAGGNGPPFVNQVAPFLLCGILLAVHREIAPFGSTGFDAAVVAFLAAGAALWAVFLRRVTGTFDREVEAVLERLSRAPP